MSASTCMETPHNNEKGGEGKESAEARREAARLEAFLKALDEIDEQFDKKVNQKGKETFKAKGKEHLIKTNEDAMVAHAQNMREKVRTLYDEAVKKDDYREEEATVKILKLFEAYQTLTERYAELKAYYPSAAARVEVHLPALRVTAKEGEMAHDDLQEQK